ncbi:DEAD/DEAH box helicase family protein [Larkinella insperata]|uniref:DEAD/DEAH box helicase family protein n=1 Tax=Larkinella insperata TaxID=332158 RepID=A0ABW3Q7K6_9BACT|nr:DEAD/DEAH box helicase family protein [Larkinella insperata]
MKIKFDSRQPYQREALNSVINLFEGQRLKAGTFELTLSASNELVSELGLGNQLTIDNDTILTNLRTVQQANSLPKSEVLNGLNFSVEMETGTGKTYVYLRTIFALNERYGFAKFIVVVPSVAIREGVMTSQRLMGDHFRELYDNVAFDTWIYDSRQVTKLRQFAQSNTLQILIMNIDSFNKQANNVIHQERDQLSGRRPIEFIQAACPIVILDEPQNMESEQAKNAIASLNPLCTLRYSATHRNLYNQVYKLDPVRAYDLKLVKRIDVNSVLDDPDFNQPFIQIQGISATKTQVSAKMILDYNSKVGPQRKTVSIKGSGADLFDLSGGRANYKNFIVDEINAADGYISFTNGLLLYVGQSYGGRTDEVLRVQIKETIREHFDRELKVKKLLPSIAGPDVKLKILSLFFIDRVINYAAEDGKIRYWFEQAYKELSILPKYLELEPLPVEKVHSGYFATYKGIPKDTRGDTAADDEAYELIMRDKERLLSVEEPLRFIFSHSALREGWDNPNVFQICTLNETKSELKKRQEIGRGLRLPVMSNGERCFDEAINRLTVVANEHYDEFARQLQTEIEEECGVSFIGRLTNKKETRLANLKPGWRLNADFHALWDRIKRHTRYSVRYDTHTLIERAAHKLATSNKLKPARISVQKSQMTMTDVGLETQLVSVREAEIYPEAAFEIPDILGYLQAKTELTRQTLAEILIKSGRLDEVKQNPQQFLDQALSAITTELRTLMVDGIKYECVDGKVYEMLLFENREVNGALTNMIDVENSIFDSIEVDSNTERQFVESMRGRQDIKLFIKLPGWFMIDTPLGKYNPDWAIVKEHDEKVYLVRETKGSKEELKLRASEWAKIRCGKAHFDALGVDYDVVTSASEI